MPSSLAPDAAPGAAPTPVIALQHFTLANGLTVCLREDHRAPLVAVQLWYHVGSSDEPPGHSGLSHLLEHLMFEGSSKLPGSQYSTLLTRLGGAPNAFTSEDATCFYVTLAKSRLEIALEAMADAMASATLDESVFARELQVVKAERRAQVDNYPLGVAQEQAQILAYGSSPYATPVIGHQADLDHMTNASVRTWYQSWYHPNNATLVVVGDIDLAQLRPLVERHFASIAANRLPARSHWEQTSPWQQRTQTVALPGLREGLIMAFNTPSQVTARNEQEACALRLIPYLLTRGASSRLRKRLVRDLPTLLALSSAYEPKQRGSAVLLLSMYSNPLEATPEEAMQQVWREIELFTQAPPTEQELKRAKANLLASLVFERDKIHAQAHAIGMQAVSGVGLGLLDLEPLVIERASAEDIRQAAQAYLIQERMSITYMTAQESRHE